MVDYKGGNSASSQCFDRLIFIVRLRVLRDTRTRIKMRVRIMNVLPSLRLAGHRRHRSTLPKERTILEVNCHEYPTDEWTNVNQRILSHLNRNLYLQVYLPRCNYTNIYII